MKKKIMALGVACVLAMGCFGAAGCSSSGGSSEPAAESGEVQEAAQPEAPAEPAELTFDVPFEFDDLSITFGSGYTTTVLDNQFSDLDGATIIALPISITNNSDETKGLNMFYYKAFGPSGTELDSVNAYFMDDDVAWMGELRPGATAETVMHILAEGDGDYYISFDNFSEQPEVRLPITLQ